VNPVLHWHAALPAADTVSPAHAVQTPPVKDVFAGHAMQINSEVRQIEAPASEDNPGRHVLHPLAPVFPEYDPAMQAVHAIEEFAPTVIEYVPVVQTVHTTEELAPTVIEYVPAGHLVHAVAPVESEYEPAGHCMHEFCPKYWFNFAEASAKSTFVRCLSQT
jgi:hypothetical protein